MEENSGRRPLPGMPVFEVHDSCKSSSLCVEMKIFNFFSKAGARGQARDVVERGALLFQAVGGAPRGGRLVFCCAARAFCLSHKKRAPHHIIRRTHTRAV